MQAFDALCANEPELAKLRMSVREFLDVDMVEHGWRPSVDSWMSSWDEEFSVRLASAGFLGLTIPRQYGGQGLGHLHRYVVTEELLAAGAPVAAHWIADRQLAPALLAYGSEEQRGQMLPAIAAGRLYSAIGMSEHGAGSDLAGIQTKATLTSGGWILNGTKVWTSGAHLAHTIVVLARSSPADPTNRHTGLSQFLVPRASPGLTISPVPAMSGEHHFNEVDFADVFVPDAAVLGEIGDGWRQATAELSFERSGPERILSTARLITAAISATRSEPPSDERTVGQVGELLARLISLRQLSIMVARALADGRPAANQAALVKDLGTRFEQNSVDAIDELLDGTTLDADMPSMVDTARLHQPMFTLRGGTNEVLRGLVARGMGVR